MNSNENMEKIKLVIWDLDETFWKGTLSEEGIVPVEEHIALVKELTDRGIMNSIVSKNDFEQAKQKLIELGIWEYFIFPAIAWAPKGVAVKHIIEDCQLRDVNVLFLDDNHLNLKEASFYNPGLHVREPDFIQEISAHPACKGKDDHSHSRLKQYKVLEKKAQEKLKFSDNLAFLRSSDIRLEIITDLSSHRDRIIELIERTNQLNFTKIRSTPEEVDRMLTDPTRSAAVIRVTDNFGKYGIVGFYCMDTQAKKLQHFIFSCRILNLGVAQYVYAKLGFPALNIVPEVAEELDLSTPDWITEMSGSEPQDIPSLEDSGDKLKIFFKGGCDLRQMFYYLEDNIFQMEEETNNPNDNNYVVHYEHSQVIIDSALLPEEDKAYILSQPYLHFIDQQFYQTKLFEANYDCLVYSVLMDYTQEVYQHKSKEIKLPEGGYHSILTDAGQQADIAERLTNRNISAVSEESLQEFARNFSHQGQISPEDFQVNLRKIRELLPAHIPIIFLNGVEIQSPNPKEVSALDRHRQMNKALEDFVASSENTFIIDVRKFVTHPSQLTNNIRHYHREAYKNISVDLLKLLKTVLDKKIKARISLKKQLEYQAESFKKFAVKLKQKLTS